MQAAGFPSSAAFSLGDIAGFRPYCELVRNQSTDNPVDRAIGTVMFYTSGTTGKPKGVRRAIPEVDPDTAASRQTLLLQLFGIGPEQDNVHFCGSPIYHTAVLNWVTNSLHFGHTVVMQNKWDAQAMLELVDRHQVTTAHLVPTQFVRLLKLPDDVRQRYNVSSMRHLLHTAAPCSPDIKQAMIDWFGPCIYEYYAATEGGGTLCNSEDWLQNPGTVGRAWPGADVRILDDHGNDVPAGEVGTVYMKMSDVSRFEYKGDKAKTEKDRVGDYFTAGDVGYLNERGFLFLCDRKIDMIISGGANIYPAEIENVLITHPQVADCCVFGIPNDEWGEEIKAVVQPVPGVSGSSVLTEDILAFCSKTLAKMKLPKSIDYVELLPRDPNGKLYKRQLRAPYWQNQTRHI